MLSLEVGFWTLRGQGSVSVVGAEVGVAGGVAWHGCPGVQGAVGGSSSRVSPGSRAFPGDTGMGAGWAAMKVDFRLVAVVRLSVHVCLVLSHATLCRMILVGLRDAVEVKLVGVALAVHLGHDVLVVVVAHARGSACRSSCWVCSCAHPSAWPPHLGRSS